MVSNRDGACEMENDPALLQAEINSWARQTFPDGNMHGIVSKLQDEIGELRAALSSRANGYYLPEVTDGYGEYGEPLTGKERDAIAEEGADVMHLLFQIAERYGFDLLTETRRKFGINQARSWGPADDRGVHVHVREMGRD